MHAHEGFVHERACARMSLDLCARHLSHEWRVRIEKEACEQGVAVLWSCSEHGPTGSPLAVLPDSRSSTVG